MSSRYRTNATHANAPSHLQQNLHPRPVGPCPPQGGRLPDRASASSMHAKSVVADLQSRTEALPFHRRWLESAFAPDVEIAALSCPRGSAKTWLMGRLAAQALTPGSPTFNPGVEVLGASASLEQSRVMLAFCREALAEREDAYRWLDSGQRLAVTHKASGTKFRILSSSGKRAMGLANFSTIYADEPGAWEARGGALMWDALRQSLGKRPGQRVLAIGTRAPAEPDSWWPALLDGGSGPGVHVEAMTAPDGAPWDAWSTIRACNPMVAHNASLRRTILRERDEARRNPTLRPAFEAHRLNRQVDATREVLLTVADWERVEARPVPEREGQPVVGIDLGAERSWSGAFALWPNGRGEAYATCPGIPDLAERERQDARPLGLYARLAELGVLLVDEGKRMARVSLLVEHLVKNGIRPAFMVADRFLKGELQDAVAGRWPVTFRRTRWSESTEDIAAFRRLSFDGPPPLSIAEQCRLLLQIALSESVVRSEDGNARLEKPRHGRSRDDVAVAGVLAAGRLVRAGAAVIAAGPAVLFHIDDDGHMTTIGGTYG